MEIYLALLPLVTLYIIKNLRGGQQLLVDLFYPVGTYYETSIESFDPNISWGGTWVLDTKGQTLVSKSDSGIFSVLNGNVGSETKKLTVSNLPSHNHTIGAHSHGLNNHIHTYAKPNSSTGNSSGNTGSTTLTLNQIPSHSHKISNYAWAAMTKRQQSHDVNQYVSPGGWTYDQMPVDTQASGGGQGHTHSLNNHSHSISTTSTNSGGASGSTANSSQFNSGSVGSGTAISVVQNSKICIRWHRIA